MLRAGELIRRARDPGQRRMVHPNTAARAFQELERQGVVAARRGKGMEVTADAPGVCRGRRQEIVRDHIREALREAGKDEYKAPRNFREEILESLKQGVPPQMKEQIERYFKNLSE